MWVVALVWHGRGYYWAGHGMSNILCVLKVAAVRGGAGVRAQVQVCVWVQCVDGVA